MNELIKIGQTIIGGGMVNTVNARELHKKLGIGRDFSNWIKDQIGRARLVEGRDFIIIAEKGEYRKPLTEYYLTLDAAKHISMISETEKGYEIREYFIEFEKRHSVQPKLTREQQNASALLMSQEVIEEQKQKIAQIHWSA